MTKQIHDEVFQKFGVDPDKIEHSLKKRLDKDLYIDFIKKSVELSGGNIEDLIANIQSRTVVLYFDTEEQADKFDNKFNMNLLKAVNHIISSLGQNPKDYDRCLIIQTSINGTENSAVLTISY